MVLLMEDPARATVIIVTTAITRTQARTMVDLLRQLEACILKVSPVTAITSTTRSIIATTAILGAEAEGIIAIVIPTSMHITSR